MISSHMNMCRPKCITVGFVFYSFNFVITKIFNPREFSVRGVGQLLVALQGSREAVGVLKCSHLVTVALG